jgi:hypothetical protein
MNEEIFSIPGTEKYAGIDSKVIKRHFPRTNNDQVLDFVFEKDPNLYLRKNKIIIKGSVEVDNGYVPDGGFVSKLFGMLTVEVDSQEVSNNRIK